MVAYSINRKETQNRWGEDFHYVGEPSAVRFWRYRERLLKIEHALEIGQLITPIIAENLGIRFWMIGNNNLRTDHVYLKQLDCVPLGVVPYPGKSVHINFLDEASGNLDTICRAMLGRARERQDRLYEASVDCLFRKGFFGFWAPTHSAPLHVRLVFRVHLEERERKIDEGTYRELVRSFRQIARR